MLSRTQIELKTVAEQVFDSNSKLGVYKKNKKERVIIGTIRIVTVIKG